MLSRTPLRRKSKSPVSQTKDRIQALVREIVMIRDGGCVLKEVRHCGGELDTEGVVIQADHLITRGNSATYADTRLIVCLCKSCHGWKHWHKEEFDALVKTILSKERVELWEKCEKDSWNPKRTTAYDWSLEEVALTKELLEIQ